MLGSLLFFLSTAFGGEWHSIGNAPAPPYFPPYRIEYVCRMVVTHGRGRLIKREEKTVELHDADFRGFGATTVDFEGQSLRLSFQRQEPEDRALLTLDAKLAGSFASATFEGALAEVKGRQHLSRGDRSVTVTAKCDRR